MSQTAQAAFMRAINDIRAYSSNPRVLDATYQLETLSTAVWPPSNDLAPAMDRWASYGFEAGQVRLLEALHSKIGRTCSYETLMSFSLFDRNIDKWHQAKVIQVYVCRIRKVFAKMKSPYRIETVWSVGYKLVLAT